MALFSRNLKERMAEFKRLYLSFDGPTYPGDREKLMIATIVVATLTLILQILILTVTIVQRIGPR